MLMRSTLPLMLLLGVAGTAGATPVTHTSSVAFLAALSGAPVTARFDDLASGLVIPSGDSADGITFLHAFDGVDLIVTDGTAAGGGGPYSTTSSPNFLGTSDLDVLLDGDDLVLGFALANAIGLFVITAESPGESLFDGDIGLTAGGVTAFLDVDAVEQTLGDGSLVFFLGVIDPQAVFTSASLDTFGGGGAFAYNIDDIITAVPEPSVVILVATGLTLLGASRRGRR